jgi:hypothetical protein
LRIHCSVCGRKSEVFHGKQIKPNVCSFCEEELRRIKQAEKDHVSLRVSCKGCGNQINSKTASKNNGFCNSTCSESSKLLNRVF